MVGGGSISGGLVCLVSTVWHMCLARGITLSVADALPPLLAVLTASAHYFLWLHKRKSKYCSSDTRSKVLHLLELLWTLLGEDNVPDSYRHINLSWDSNLFIVVY